MFPAGAGMNRFSAWIVPVSRNVPRRRGDEPGSVGMIGIGS